MNENEAVYLETLLGSQWQAVVDSLSTTEMMQHLDPNYRRAGIVLHKWKKDCNASLKLITLFTSDSDENVKADALISLGRCFHGSSNRTIGVFLLSVLLDEHQPLICRQAAYIGIVDIFRPSTIYSSILTAVDSMPKDIDYQSIITLVYP